MHPAHGVKLFFAQVAWPSLTSRCAACTTIPMDEPAPTPLQILAASVKAAGGVSAVARRIGTSAPHLSNVVTGARPVAREIAARLRPVLSDVPAEVWVELLAPMPVVEPVTEASP